MATNYYVRVFCETEHEYKREVQVDAVDPDWIPDGCSGHILKDFVIEDEEQV